VELSNKNVEIPAGTIRRWASEGIISSPKRYTGLKGGWHADWPKETVNQILTHYIFQRIKKQIANTNSPEEFLEVVGGCVSELKERLQ
jgi:hypothetical protein